MVSNLNCSVTSDSKQTLPSSFILQTCAGRDLKDHLQFCVILWRHLSQCLKTLIVWLRSRISTRYEHVDWIQSDNPFKKTWASRIYQVRLNIQGYTHSCLANDATPTRQIFVHIIPLIKRVFTILFLFADLITMQNSLLVRMFQSSSSARNWILSKHRVTWHSSECPPLQMNVVLMKSI